MDQEERLFFTDRVFLKVRTHVSERQGEGLCPPASGLQRAAPGASSPSAHVPTAHTHFIIALPPCAPQVLLQASAALEGPNSQIGHHSAGCLGGRLGPWFRKIHTQQLECQICIWGEQFAYQGCL